MSSILDSIDSMEFTNEESSDSTEINLESGSGAVTVENEDEEDYIDSIVPPCVRTRDVTLYTVDVGPQIYNAKGSLVTPPIITRRLPDVFAYLPVFGAPPKNVKLEDFFNQKIREFVGCDMNDEEFSELERYCR